MVVDRRSTPDLRRAAILDAATAAFGAAPYPTVQVARIAGAVGVSEALVFRYYPTKAELAAAVARRVADTVRAGRRDAERLVGSSTARVRVRAALEVHIDAVAAAPAAWVHLRGSQPAAVHDVWRELDAEHVAWLRSLLVEVGWLRHDYALAGWTAFVQDAALTWAERGSPADERWAVVDACIGALEGALGDWGR